MMITTNLLIVIVITRNSTKMKGILAIIAIIVVIVSFVVRKVALIFMMKLMKMYMVKEVAMTVINVGNKNGSKYNNHDSLLLLRCPF